MNKFFSVALIFILLFSATAWAGEEENPVTTPGENEDKVTPEEIFTLSLFGYSIVVIPATADSPASVGLFANDEKGEPEEELSTFTVGGILGKAVSTVAKIVPGGPGHGKVVREFVKKAVEQRKLTLREKVEKKKAKIKTKVEARKAKIRDRVEAKKIKIRERRTKAKARVEAKKAEIKARIEAEKEKARVKFQYSNPKSQTPARQ